MNDKILIRKGITIAIQVVSNVHKDFNPNIEECYRVYNLILCKTFSEAMFELTGISGTMVKGTDTKKGTEKIVCKYGSYWVDIGYDIYMSKFKPKRFKTGG